MITKQVNTFYITAIPTSAIGKEKDIAVHSNGNMYVKKGGTWILLNSGGSMRGVAVFVSATAPENPEVNDLWIII